MASKVDYLSTGDKTRKHKTMRKGHHHQKRSSIFPKSNKFSNSTLRKNLAKNQLGVDIEAIRAQRRKSKFFDNDNPLFALDGLSNPAMIQNITQMIEK